MHIKNIIIGIFVGLLLVSCTNTTSLDSRPTPRSTYGGDDAAHLFVLRERAPPIAVKATLWLDGRDYGKLGSRTYLRLTLPPGEHEVKITFPIWAATPSAKAKVELSANEDRYLYHSSDMNVHPAGTLVLTSISPDLHELDHATFKNLMRVFRPSNN